MKSTVWAPTCVAINLLIIALSLLETVVVHRSQGLSRACCHLATFLRNKAHNNSLSRWNHSTSDEVSPFYCPLSKRRKSDGIVGLLAFSRFSQPLLCLAFISTSKTSSWWCLLMLCVALFSRAAVWRLPGLFNVDQIVVFERSWNWNGSSQLYFTCLTGIEMTKKLDSKSVQRGLILEAWEASASRGRRMWPNICYVHLNRLFIFAHPVLPHLNCID